LQIKGVNKIKLAVIGGSGAYQLAKTNWGKRGKPEIVATPFGPSAPLHTFIPPDTPPFIFISRHGEKGYHTSAPFVNYRANIWALKEKGVERIVSWSGPGAINQGFQVGDYVIPHDLIDFTKARAGTFFRQKGLGFIRQNTPFCPQGRQALQQALEQAGVSFHPGGVYLCTEGPRLETPAEIKFFALIGADMVGMTLVPEVFLARELEMCYTSLCYITNYAEGIKELPYDSGVLFEGGLPAQDFQKLTSSVEQIGKLLPQILKTLALSERSCTCKDAMLRYRKRGDIGQDWHTWMDTK